MIGTKTATARVVALDINDSGKITTVRVKRIDQDTRRLIGEEEKAYLGPGAYGCLEEGSVKVGSEVIIAYRTAPLVMGFVCDASDDT